jgi:hypothetical protein
MMWRALWPLLMSAFLGLVSANFLLGLPGAFFMDLLLAPAAVEKIGPGAMGWAAVVSMLAPFGIAPAMWAMMAWRPVGAWWQWMGAGFAGYLVAGAIATFNIV